MNSGRVYVVLILLVTVAVVLITGQWNSTAEQTPAAGASMTVDQLRMTPKVDAHAHFAGLGPGQQGPMFEALREENMHWLNITTGGLRWETTSEKIELAAELERKYPKQVYWVTTFNLENWNDEDWLEQALATIEESFERGAAGVKVWKEIGMVLKDPDSSFVMIDDPRFDPVFEYIESRNKTLVAHIGEPRNCWLPLEEMTVNNDRGYFEQNPRYHAYLHPEIPGYWEQIKARDNVLEKHPGLRFMGCHMASLEFDVDELAKRFDKYPNLCVDLAARVCHLQVQDRQKVRDFMIKYQDRVLYGTDLAAGSSIGGTLEEQIERMKTTYEKDYRYFATDEEMEVWEVDGPFRGLALPPEVLRKIFHDNFFNWFPQS